MGMGGSDPIEGIATKATERMGNSLDMVKSS